MFGEEKHVLKDTSYVRARAPEEQDDLLVYDFPQPFCSDAPGEAAEDGAGVAPLAVARAYSKR